MTTPIKGRQRAAVLVTAEWKSTRIAGARISLFLKPLETPALNPSAVLVIAERKSAQIAGAKILLLLKPLETPAFRPSALQKILDDTAVKPGLRVSVQGRVTAGITSRSRKRRVTRIR